MTKRITALAVITLFGLFGGAAADEVVFRLAPGVRTGFGDTRFEIAFTTLDADSNLVGGGSKLIFPLNFVQAGLDIGVDVLRDGHRAWTVDLGFTVATDDPRNRMVDDDWDNVGPVEVLWSHTLSRVDGSAWTADLEVTRLITAAADAELSAVVGVTLQKMQQDMTDLEGWLYFDYDANGQPESYIWQDDELAGTYEVRYVRPRIGAQGRWTAGRLTTVCQATVSPLTYVKDIDDHVRRGFQIRTDGKGFGAGGRLALRYDFPASGARPFVTVAGDYFRAEIDVSGLRNYYRDLPEYGISAGDSFSEAHRVTTTQYGLKFSAGLQF